MFSSSVKPGRRGVWRPAESACSQTCSQMFVTAEAAGFNQLLAVTTYRGDSHSACSEVMSPPGFSMMSALQTLRAGLPSGGRKDLAGWSRSTFVDVVYDEK
ncbi:hypothetical protein AMECASPLE_021978 [Ameca splendens]|uniref:Uncharacterized protein n=1 Tax=Ameca splendens TaxID=208324 RepID=A0ABV0XGR4_9TELE